MTTHRKLTSIRTLMLSAVLLCPSLGLAQDGLGYVFATGGSRTDTKDVQAGVGLGIEKLFRQFGAGGEFQLFTGIGGSDDSKSGALASANGSYYFRKFTHSLIPFTAAGYSRLIGCGSQCGGANGFNFGGGLILDNGFRLEIRDHVFKTYGTMHKWEVRVGIVLCCPAPIP